MRFIMKVASLPTWFLVRMAQPKLKDSHPLKNRNITLSEWAEFGTPLTKLIDSAIWGYLALICFLIVKIVLEK